MQLIQVYGELLFELKDKQDWINKVPRILPAKTRGAETWLWVDSNGHVFECGADFQAAEEHKSYPCKVYRVNNVANYKPEERHTFQGRPIIPYTTGEPGR